MTSTNRLTTAYAGHGDITEENAAAILDQLLPQNLGLVLIPNLPKRVPSGAPAQPGLRKAIKWLESQVGETGTIPVDDLIGALLARAEYEEDGETFHDDLALVMVFDPESEADVELANAAHDAGIRVVNLAAAGDDLVFEDDLPEAQQAAEQAAKEVPPFEGGTPSAEPEATAAGAPSPAEAVAKAVGAGVAAAAQHAAQSPAPGVAIQFTIDFDPATVRALAQAIVAAMGAQAQQAVAAAEPPGATVTHIGTKGGVATDQDPAGQPPNTVVYYYNKESGLYRPARGKARAEEQRVFLSPEEVAKVKGSKLLA